MFLEEVNILHYYCRGRKYYLILTCCLHIYFMFFCNVCIFCPIFLQLWCLWTSTSIIIHWCRFEGFLGCFSFIKPSYRPFYLYFLNDEIPTVSHLGLYGKFYLFCSIWLYLKSSIKIAFLLFSMFFNICSSESRIHIGMLVLFRKQPL